jgi:hypothetical protein
MKVSFRLLLCTLLVGPLQSAAALAGAAVSLADHSSAAVSLFNNMRTPAALIAGSLVPLGIMTAPQIEEGDSNTKRLMKKANMLLGVISLLSEILAVTYSSIAINKLVEVSQPATAGVAELISQQHELAWIGANVHFLLGMMGFSLIVGSRAYFTFSNSSIGKVSFGWGVAAFFQALSVVNKGIAMGHGITNDPSKRFASNFFTLILRYISLGLKNARGGVCATAAVAVAVLAMFQTIKVLMQESNSEKSHSD